MEQPARRLDNDEQPGQVYDTRHGTDPSSPRPDLKAIEGGGQTTEPRRGHLREAGTDDRPSREDLSSAESSGGLANSDSKATGEPGSRVNHVYNPGSPLRSRFSIRGRLSRRRAILGSGLLGTIIAFIFFFTITSGPAQFVQLAELLQHDLTKSQSDSQNRTTHLLRDYKAIKKDDYRYTRVGLIGAKVMAKVYGQFEDAGVKFTGNDSFGRPTGIEIDRPIVEKNFPETNGMSDDEFNNWLNEKFDVNSGLSFETAESGKSYKLDINGLKSQSIRSFINKAGTEILGDSKALTAVKVRDLNKFFGLDSLFHPFSRAIQNKIAAKAAEIQKQNPNESEGAAEEAAASDIEDVNFDSDVSTIEEPGIEGFEQGHDEANGETEKAGSSTAPYVGAIYGVACTLKGTATALVAVNRFLIVLPAAVEATSLISMGSQVQNGGNDITMDQLGAIAKGFTNSAGQNIWSGAALQALSGSEKVSSLPKNSDGSFKNDIPLDYKQAFGSDALANTLKSIGNAMLTWFPFPSWLGGPCGTLGGLTLFIGGAVGQIADAIVNAPDGETLDVGSQAAVRGLEDVGLGYAKSEAYGPIMRAAIDWIAKSVDAPKLARGAFSGPVGGDLIAYGARAAANSAAILNGGLAIANSATSTIIGSAGQEQQQQFNSESTLAKIFDENDYRSLAGQLADHASSSFLTNVASMARSALNIGSLFSRGFSLFTPHAAADSNSNSWTGSYNWGFPQYGIPDNMLNDPALSDPYQNAEAVGKYLSSVCTDGNGNIGPNYGACAGSSGYTARIMDCFGNALTYSPDSDIGGNVWDVAHAATATSTSTDVNPVSDTYQGANCGGICSGAIADCGNTGEENWEKIVMFVNDAWNIKSLDCLGGYTNTSERSCADLGIDDTAPSSTSSGGSTTSGGTNSLPQGASQQLAKQLLPYIADGKIKCGSAAGGSGAANCQDIQNTAKGVPVGGNCAVNAITPHLLGLILGLVRDDGWTLGISAICSNHSVEGDGPYAGHSYGSAADFSIQNGASGAAAAANEKFVDDAAALLSSVGGSFGQIQCHPDYPVLDNSIFTTFNDTCNHQHIRAAP